MFAPRFTLTITDVGGMGDGIGYYEGKPVFVPFTCIGDEIIAGNAHQKGGHITASLLEVLTPSPNRQVAPCIHFGQCGGCALQHHKPLSYTALKQNQIVKMLQSLHVSPEILQPMLEVGSNSRRRAEFKVAVHKGTITLGFQKAQTHQLIDVQQCPVVVEEIEQFLPQLRQQIQAMHTPSAINAVQITALEAGLDVLLLLRTPLKPRDYEAWRAFAQASVIIRLSQQIEHEPLAILYDTHKTVVVHGGVSVLIPPASFQQASASAQVAMQGMVSAAMQACASVLDLYAGCGTFSFPLAMQGKNVTAVEGSGEMIGALQNAANAAGLAANVVTEIRDLMASPIPTPQLNAYDGVVINPPRNGALPQVEQIAKSNVTTVVMVSCNPATFQRDAATLLQADYTLKTLTAVDQFTWSKHLELVAVFEKNNQAPARFASFSALKSFSINVGLVAPARP